MMVVMAPLAVEWGTTTRARARNPQAKGPMAATVVFANTSAASPTPAVVVVAVSMARMEVMAFIQRHQRVPVAGERLHQ